MKNRLILYLSFATVFTTAPMAAKAADADDEQKQIQVLQSNAGPAEKDAACARLKFIGTSRSVPALAALLTNNELSHSARYALEPMQSDAAGAALVSALDKTTGLIRVGIINSLGARQEQGAVPALIKLVGEQEADSSSAAARALGQIGGPQALKALRASYRSSTGPMHEAVTDGLLRCANSMLRSGDRTGALAVFEQLDTPRESDGVRVAAFNGKVRASDNAGLNLVLHAVSGPSGPGQLAALQLARDLQAPGATRELSKLLPSLQPAVQISLVGALAQRGDVRAVQPLADLAAKAQPEVRVAILQAMDNLGDASVVGLLADSAASGTAEEQKAARQALADLHRGNVTEALIEQMSGARPAAQEEIARALGARGDRAAVTKLLDVAQSEPQSARKGALQALSLLADDSQLTAMVALVLRAQDAAGRAQAAEALNATYQRLATRQGHMDVEPLVHGIQRGATESKIALMPICAGLVDPKVRAALRSELQDQDSQTQAAAVRALCDTEDAELLPDLLEIARSTPQDSVRSLSINGAVRLLSEEPVKLAASERVSALKSLMSVASQPAQKRKVVAGLGEIPSVESLRIIDAALDDNELHSEAARAAVKVATALPGDQAEAGLATLNKALGTATDSGTHEAVQAARTQIQESADYLTNWEVAGPYQKKDTDYAALFDIAFGPELKDSKTNWTLLRAGLDPKRPWVMDLLKTLGGEQRAAYARTWLYSDEQREALLELGSDDGVKVWLNDKQVYALNIARALQPGSDKVKLTLQAGWNPLLLKITQNNQGWEFCARIRNPDGTHLNGIRCDSAPSK